MKYKALEDLINILVKKSGTDLSVQTVSNEVSRLEEKKKKLKKEKDTLESKLESGEYILQMEQNKDANEKNYLEKSIKSLKEELESLSRELEQFSRVLESGEVYYNSLLLEIDELRVKAKKLKVKVDMGMDSSGEAQNEYTHVTELLCEKLKEKARKKLIEEEIARVEDEIRNTEEMLKNLEDKISKSDYKDDLTYSTDKLLLVNLEEEIKSLDEALLVWQNSAQVLGAKVLDAFKSGKDIDDVKGELDTLVSMSNVELKLTQEEINGSNIFEIMDNYDRLSKDIKDKVQTFNYNDEEERENVNVKQNYHREKINKYKLSLESIESRKSEVLNLMSLSKNLSEEVKRARLCKENKLIALENRLFNMDTLDVKGDELKKIDKLIGEIKIEIENEKYLENEYTDDIYVYKEELKNLDINYVTIGEEISKEEKILDILNSKVRENDTCEDKLLKLNDSILSIEYVDRIKSLRSQQQYLYVDSKVIKEEVCALWGRAGVSEREEIIIPNNDVVNEVVNEVVSEVESDEGARAYSQAEEEKTEQTQESDVIADAVESINEVLTEAPVQTQAPEGDDIEILDDFEFEDFDEE